jgi:gluconate 5-dehydrogenase
MTHAMDLFKLDGKVALVTGGSRGLGLAAAEGLAEAGADVAICGRDEGSLATALEQLKKAGRDCIAVKCDVSKEDDVLQMVSQVKEHYGRCDVLVNSAGVGGMVPSTQMTTDAWNAILATNLTGTFLCCREIGKLMIEQQSGSIINLSSENGQVGFAWGMAAYATTKIGVIGMSRSLAAEWGQYEIRVNALLPGNTEVGMMESMNDTESPFYKLAGESLLSHTPLKRFGTADDMKGTTVFLASDASRYVTGAMLVFDGGFTINAIAT